MSSLKENIPKAIEEFNKYRAPGAVTELLTIHEDWFKIEFTGAFCQACGYHDYFGDFTVFLEEIGAKPDIAEIKEIANGAVVRFSITN